MSRSVFVAQLLLVITVTIGCSGKTETETENDNADKNVQAKKQPSRNGDEHRPSGKTEENAATASTKERQPSDDSQSPVQPIGLAYLPDDYNIALVFHPQRILNHPSITPELRGDVAEAISEVLDEKELPMLEGVPDINSIEQAIVMADAQIMEIALDAASRDKAEVKIIRIEEDEGGDFDEFDPRNRNRIPKEELKELDVPPLDLREFRDETPTDIKDFKPPRFDLRPSPDDKSFMPSSGNMQFDDSYVSFLGDAENDGDNDVVQRLLDRAEAGRKELESYAQAAQNLRRIMLGMHNYSDARGELPRAFSVDKDGKPLLSWRVHLLPYISAEKLYQEFHLDEPWDSEHNKNLIPRMPEVYATPGKASNSGKTRYLAMRGKNSVLSDLNRGSFARLKDGTSNSLAVVEAAEQAAAVWTKPQDFDVEHAEYPVDLFGSRDRFLAAFADGHVESIAAPLEKASFLSLGNAADGVVPDYNTKRIGSGVESIPGLVMKLRFSEAIDAEKEARRILDQQQIESQDIDGKTYYFSKDALRGCLAIDGRTIVVTPTSVLPKIIDAEADSGDPLKNELRSISRENDFIAAFVVPDHLRDQAGTLADSLGKEIPPGFQDLAKLPAGLDAASLQINLSGDTLARLRVKLNDKELANGIASAASKGLDLGKMSLALVNKRESPNSVQNLTLSLGTDLLKNIKVKQSETLLSISVAAPEKFGERVATLMQEAKKAAEATFQANQLKQVGLGLHNHHDVHKVLPPGWNETLYDNEGMPKLSWRVHILPFIEHGNLYDQFRRDQPWDSEHNIKLLDQMPDIYRTTDNPTKTTLMMVVGEGTAYEGKRGLTFSSFNDGLSKTIMVVRAGTDKSVPWTKPEDLPFDPENPVAAFGKIESNEFIVLMADGSVHRLPKETAPESWRGFLTRAGGEKVTLPGPTAKRFDVSGKVSFNDGKPLTSGRILFARDETEGFTHMNADGTYSLGKLREGTYTIYIAEPNDGGESGRTLPPVHPKYLSPKTSSIQLNLRSDISYDIVIERP